RRAGDAEDAGEEIVGERGEDLEEVLVDDLSLEDPLRPVEQMALVGLADGERVGEEVRERQCGDEQGGEAPDAQEVTVTDRLRSPPAHEVAPYLRAGGYAAGEPRVATRGMSPSPRASRGRSAGRS